MPITFDKKLRPFPDDRPSFPSRNGLDNRSRDLTMVVTDANQSVQLARHHIIPIERIKNFWNALAEDGAPEGMAEFFLKVHGTYKEYHNGIFAEDSTEAIGIILTGLAFGINVDAMKNVAEAWDSLFTILTWLPGNLFLGPQGPGFDKKNLAILSDNERRAKCSGVNFACRMDDPGNNFETPTLGTILTPGEYNLYSNLDLELQHYARGKPLESISHSLAVIASAKNVYKLNPQNWNVPADAGPSNTWRYSLKSPS